MQYLSGKRTTFAFCAMEKVITRKRNLSDSDANEPPLKNSPTVTHLVSLIEGFDSPSIDQRFEQAETDLNVEYFKSFIPVSLRNHILDYIESNVKYYNGNKAKVRVFGKWHDIPRKQVSFGDKGLCYKFSGITIQPLQWDVVIRALTFTNKISDVCGCRFNFVLVNRYANGDDYIGEHKDNEKELDKTAPIASLSLGQSRDFILRHESVKLNRPSICKFEKPDNIVISLDSGSLLLIKPPTNDHWYHQVPKRKNTPGVRINLTFRKMMKP